MAHEKAHEPLFVFARERYRVDAGRWPWRSTRSCSRSCRPSPRAIARACSTTLRRVPRKEGDPVSLVDEHLERNTELFAVVQNRRVRVRNAPWTDVHVLSVVKGTDLAFTVDLGVFEPLRTVN